MDTIALKDMPFIQEEYCRRETYSQDNTYISFLSYLYFEPFIISFFLNLVKIKFVETRCYIICLRYFGHHLYFLCLPLILLYQCYYFIINCIAVM